MRFFFLQILNTVCVVCIGKIERFVKKIDPDIIFGDYIKEQNLCEEEEEEAEKETEIVKKKISTKIVPTNDRRENNDKESGQSFGNTTAMEIDLQQRRNKPNTKSEQTDVTDGENNLPYFSTPRDTKAKFAETAQPPFGGESRTLVPINFPPLVKSQPEKETLAKLVCRLEFNGRKRRLDRSDESKVLESAPTRTEKIGGDAVASKISL